MLIREVDSADGEYMAGSRIHNDLRGRRARDRGASLVEYSLLLALIAVVVLVAVSFFGGELSESFDESGSSLHALAPAP